jgi:cytochrome c oxidase subunit 2
MKEFFDITGLLGFPDAASTHAHDLDYMTGLVHWLMLLLFVGWGGFFLYTLYRFRASKNPEADYDGVKGHTSTYQEGAVVLAEVLLLFVFAIPTWSHFKNDLPAAEQSTEVHVVAEQFAWNIHYPGPDGIFGQRDIELIDLATNPLGLDRSDPNAADDITTVNELHVPNNKPVLIHLTSKDVIHSFSLPHMRVKQDAIPGLTIPVWFVPNKSGEYEIACAQLCGLSHYRMRGFVTIDEDEASFNTWLDEQAQYQ